MEVSLIPYRASAEHLNGMFSTLPGLKCLKIGGGLSISISSLLPKLGLKVLELFLVSNMFKATPDVDT